MTLKGLKISKTSDSQHKSRYLVAHCSANGYAELATIVRYVSQSREGERERGKRRERNQENCLDTIADALLQVDGLHGATELAMGGAHTLALRQTDDVVAWGANQNGVLGMGIGVSQDAQVPTRVPKLSCSQVRCYLW